MGCCTWSRLTNKIVKLLVLVAALDGGCNRDCNCDCNCSSGDDNADGASATTAVVTLFRTVKSSVVVWFRVQLLNIVFFFSLATNVQQFFESEDEYQPTFGRDWNYNKT